MKRFTFLAIIIFSLGAAPALAAEDAPADVASTLRAAAEYLRPVFRALDGQTLYFLAEVLTDREFEEMEVLERLADSEQGKEAVAAACREALSGDDPLLKVVAFYFLWEIEGAEAYAYLADLYDSVGEGDVLILAIAGATALARAEHDEVPTVVAEGLYARLERDLASDDKATRLKAAKSVAFMPSERGRALAVSGMRSPDADVRRWCVINLAYAPTVDYGVLEVLLSDDDPSVRAAAARRAADAGEAKFIPPLLASLEDGDVSVRRAAASSIASLLGDVGAADKGVSEKLLKRLKAEGDGVTRCFLAEAYGAATAEDWFGRQLRQLTDDGYWALFAGEWREKDLESYYEYNGVSDLEPLLEEPAWPEEAEEVIIPERPVFVPTKVESLIMLDDVLGAAEDTLGWDDVFCAISLDKSVGLFEDLQPYYAPGTFDRAFVDDAIATAGDIKTWVEKKICDDECIDPMGVDAKEKKKQIRTIRYRVQAMVIPPPSEPIPEWKDDLIKEKWRERGEILKRKWAERDKE
jgi:HEAT repeat protein